MPIAARAAAEASLTSYVQRQQALPTTTQLHVGLDIAEKIVRYRGIEKSFSELHQIARDFLAGNASTLEALRVKLVAKHDLPATTTVDASVSASTTPGPGRGC